MKRIILLRHAQCEGEGYIGAGSDVHLTRTGHARAVQLIAEIEDLAPEMIYSSPLLRCRETLMPYLEKNQQTLVSYDAALREMEFGSFESLTYEQISRRYPEAQTAWYANQITGRPPGGESLQELHSRVEGFLSRKILKCPAERILICAHGDHSEPSSVNCWPSVPVIIGISDSNGAILQSSISMMSVSQPSLA